MLDGKIFHAIDSVIAMASMAIVDYWPTFCRASSQDSSIQRFPRFSTACLAFERRRIGG
jgi:hypothetical protein